VRFLDVFMTALSLVMGLVLAEVFVGPLAQKRKKKSKSPRQTSVVPAAPP
jgi:uncharacterized membrane protein YjjB (DUF3815 family)